jgi:hypothetical protein
VLASSWQRSLASGAGQDATRLPAVRLVGSDLDERRDRHVLARSLPLLRGLLGDGVMAAGGVLAVSDADGVLLWLYGEATTLLRISTINFVEGADWSESCAGTNAPGTALVVGRPVQVIGAEHYNSSVQAWSCVAAPVHDPDSGRIVGTIDITGRDEVDGPLALTLARATVSALEADLRHKLALRDARARERFLHRYGAADPVAVLLSPRGRVVSAPRSAPVTRRLTLPRRLDGPDLLVAGRRAQLEPFGTDGYLVLHFLEPSGAEGGPRRHPPDPTVIHLSVLGTDKGTVRVDGRTVRLTPRLSEIMVLMGSARHGVSAARLAVDLSPADLSTTGVRVEMSRLRLALGPHLLASQPYRLLRPVRSDLDVVRDLLAAGNVAEAIERYSGPLLPGSQAPAVVEQRTGLEQQLRGALLACADPVLLRRWVDAPWGHDDQGAWVALARSLPVGSPKRAAAAQRARGLDAELGLGTGTHLLPRRP